MAALIEGATRLNAAVRRLRSAPSGAGQSRLRRMYSSSLREADFADIDPNHQHLRDGSASRSTRVGAALRRQVNAIGNRMVRCELRRRETAGDVDAVVVPPQCQALVKEEILNQTVR